MDSMQAKTMNSVYVQNPTTTIPRKSISEGIKNRVNLYRERKAEKAKAEEEERKRAEEKAKEEAIWKERRETHENSIKRAPAAALSDFKQTMYKNKSAGYYKPVYTEYQTLKTKEARDLYKQEIYKLRKRHDKSFQTEEEKAAIQRGYAEAKAEAKRKEQRRNDENDELAREHRLDRMSRNSVPFSSKDHHYSYDSAIKYPTHNVVSIEYIKKHSF